MNRQTYRQEMFRKYKGGQAHLTKEQVAFLLEHRGHVREVPTVNQAVDALKENLRG